jgi:hypothetical protein
MLFEIRKDKKGAPKQIEPSTLTKQQWQEKDLENYLRENLVNLVGGDLLMIGKSRPCQRAIIAWESSQTGGGWRTSSDGKTHQPSLAT